MPATSQAHTFRKAREIAGLTIEQVATELGLTRQAVSAWENGISTPTGPARRLLAQLFTVPLEVVDSWFERPKSEVA